MAHALVQARFNRTSNKPEDVVVNTFHFEMPDVTSPHVEDAADQVVTFYTQAHSGEAALMTQMSTVITPGGHEVRVYDADQDPMGPPIYVQPFVISGQAAQTGLPSEVALCLSYKNLSPGEIRRRRGRLYFGPLSQVAAAQPSEGDTRPGQGVMEALLAAGIYLRTGVFGGANWRLWSPTDNVLRLIDQVSVDNAWDTQRRRGADPTQRLVAP